MFFFTRVTPYTQSSGIHRLSPHLSCALFRTRSHVKNVRTHAYTHRAICQVLIVGVQRAHARRTDQCRRVQLSPNYVARIKCKIRRTRRARVRACAFPYSGHCGPAEHTRERLMCHILNNHRSVLEMPLKIYAQASARVCATHANMCTSATCLLYSKQHTAQFVYVILFLIHYFLNIPFDERARAHTQNTLHALATPA